MKSSHVLYYVLEYKKIDLCKITGTVNNEIEEENLFYDNFVSLFSKNEILTYDIDLYNNYELLLKNNVLNVSFNIDSAKLRIVKAYKIAILELVIENTSYFDYPFIARHIDKNQSFGVNDSFCGMDINNQEFITGTSDINITLKNVNKLFFNDSLEGIKFILGRKNYQIMAIVSDSLSSKVININDKSNLEIYKIATAEHTKHLGDKTFNSFLDTTYDKWMMSGSIYIVNNLKMLQIVDVKNQDFINASIKNYRPVVTFSLVQKAIFVKFQAVRSNNLTINKFNNFLNKYYFVELSSDSQTQKMYELLKINLNNQSYYNILKEEIHLINTHTTSNIIIILTAIYTLFALLGVIVPFILN